MGLQTTDEIPYGKTFGPIKTLPSSRDPKYAIGHLTKDKYPQEPMTKISLSVLDDPVRVTDWLTHINPARNEVEQNMEIYTKEGAVYYRALRTILPDEEILAWYSRDLAATLTIPDILPIHIKEDGSLHCPMCNQSFQQPFTLRAHLAFICEHRLANDSTPLDMTTPRQRPSPTLLVPTPGPVPLLATRTPPITTRERINNNTPSPYQRDTTDHDDRASSKHGLDHEDVERTHKKRRTSGGWSSGDEDTDRNQNIRSKPDERTSPPRLIVDQPFSPSSSYQTSPDISPIPVTFPSSVDPRNESRLDPRHLDHRFSPMIKPMLPYLPYPTRPLVDMRLPDLNQEIRQLEASVVHNRLINERMCVPFPVKTQNPVVEKLLSAPISGPSIMPSGMVPMNLLQNWCAKCNATFRMTSDLVYHMRSQHKKDSDPVRKQRDEKLKCSICNESFKERHHLTRHMTSHL